MWSPCSAEKIRENKRLGCLADRPHLLSQSQWDHSKTQQVPRYFYKFAFLHFLPFFAYSHLQVPGYFYTAQEQCRFFYHGKEGADKANPENDPFICENLKCKQGDEEVNTGPPLEGTACGGQGTQWCRAVSSGYPNPTRYPVFHLLPDPTD